MSGIDTSSARHAILGRIRIARGRFDEITLDEAEEARAYLERHPQGPRLPLPDDLSERFVEQAFRFSTTVEIVDALDDAPHAVHRYLSDQGIAPRAVAWPMLQMLDWAGAQCQVDFRQPNDADLVGITGCFCALAETGTLALLSGRQCWTTAGLLPETHIAIVPKSRLVPGLEEAFSLMRTERGELPRSVNFISGPSRTGDLEQTIVLGAHGPYRVHAVLIAGA